MNIKMDFNFMNRRTRELCKTIVGFVSIPIRKSRNILMMKEFYADKNRNGIPEELLEQLSEYIEDDHVLIIAHRDVVRSF